MSRVANVPSAHRANVVSMTWCYKETKTVTGPQALATPIGKQLKSDLKVTGTQALVTPIGIQL